MAIAIPCEQRFACSSEPTQGTDETLTKLRTRLVAGEGSRPPDDSVLAEAAPGSQDSDFFLGASSAALPTAAPCDGGSRCGGTPAVPCGPAVGAVWLGAIGGASGTGPRPRSCRCAETAVVAALPKAGLPAVGTAVALIAALLGADAAPGGTGTKNCAGGFACCAGLPAEPLSRVSHGASAPVVGGGARLEAARRPGACGRIAAAMLSTGTTSGRSFHGDPRRAYSVHPCGDRTWNIGGAPSACALPPVLSTFASSWPLIAAAGRYLFARDAQWSAGQRPDGRCIIAPTRINLC